MSVHLEKVGALALITALVCIYILLPIPNFLKNPQQNCVLCAFTHHFYHANVFHLAVNCLCIFTLANRRMKISTILTAYVIASCSYFTANCSTIGFSNILFAIMGLGVSKIDLYWLRHNNIFLMTMLIMLLFPQFSAITHIVSFAGGVAVSLFVGYLKRLFNDTKKAGYRR